MLLIQGYPANIVTIDHVTPLHEACLSGHIACVRALISSGANVSISGTFYTLHTYTHTNICMCKQGD